METLVVIPSAARNGDQRCADAKQVACNAARVKSQPGCSVPATNAR